MRKTELIIFLSVMFVVTLVAFLKAGFVEQHGIVAQVWVTIILVLLTAVYVSRVRQQADASMKIAEATKRQAEIMLNAQFNAVAPVVRLSPAGIRTISIIWHNIGMGPALNFRCWIEDEEHPQLRDACKIVMCRGAIAKGVKEEKTIDTEIDGYTLHAGVGYGYLRAQYESVFGKTYESRLISSTNAAPELKYFEVKNDEDIVIL